MFIIYYFFFKNKIFLKRIRNTVLNTFEIEYKKSISNTVLGILPKSAYTYRYCPQLIAITTYFYLCSVFFALRVEIEHIHGQVEENPYLAATAVPRAPQPTAETTKLPPVASDSDSSS